MRALFRRSTEVTLSLPLACIGIFKLWRCTLPGRRQFAYQTMFPISQLLGSLWIWLWEGVRVDLLPIHTTFWQKRFFQGCAPLQRKSSVEQWGSSVQGPQDFTRMAQGLPSPRNQSPGHQQPIGQVVLRDNHSLTKAKQTAAWQQRSLFFRCILISP